MKKVYIILNASHHIDDYGVSTDIEYITDSLEDAINKMRKKNEFCESQMNNEKWVYHYILRGYNLPYTRISDNSEYYTECKNYKEEELYV